MGSFKEQLDADLNEVFFKTGEDADGNDVSEFAETFVYRPGSGAGHYEVSGIFDASTEIAATGGNSKVETKFIRVMLKEADIKDRVNPRDQLVVRNKLYRFAEPPQSDGVGVLTLVLEELSVAPSA